MHSQKLNRRHRTGLCLTAIAAGTLLVTAPQPQIAWFAIKATGVVLIGIAVTWLMGELARLPRLILSSSLLCIGILIAILPVWHDWQLYRATAREFEEARAAVLAGKPAASNVFWCEASLSEALEKASPFAAWRDSAESECYDPPRTSFAWSAWMLSHPVSTPTGLSLAIFGLMCFGSLSRHLSEPKDRSETEHAT